MFIKEKQLKLLWAKDQLDPEKQKNKRSAEDAGAAGGPGQSGGDGKLVIEDKSYFPSMDPSNYVSRLVMTV